jgi:SAM-dependent methyltransferase
MAFLLTNLILLVTITILLIILSWVWPPDSPWAPWWRTDKKTARAMCILANVNKNDIVYDLGCGDATSLIVAAKEYGAKAKGVEIDPLRVIIARFFKRFSGVGNKVIIEQKNLFDTSISDASVLFLYLVPKALKKLKPKLLKELKPGTRIVSLVYEIDLPLIQHDKKNNLRLYKI